MADECMRRMEIVHACWWHGLHAWLMTTLGCMGTWFQELMQTPAMVTGATSSSTLTAAPRYPPHPPASTTSVVQLSACAVLSHDLQCPQRLMCLVQSNKPSWPATCSNQHQTLAQATAQPLQLTCPAAIPAGQAVPRQTRLAVQATGPRP